MFGRGALVADRRKASKKKLSAGKVPHAHTRVLRAGEQPTPRRVKANSRKTGCVRGVGHASIPLRIEAKIWLSRVERPGLDREHLVDGKRHIKLLAEHCADEILCAHISLVHFGVIRRPTSAMLRCCIGVGRLRGEDGAVFCQLPLANNDTAQLAIKKYGRHSACAATCVEDLGALVRTNIPDAH
eukprot:scaffold272067_cov28-Tisochrysis_lutea.AAC.3